MSRQAGIKEFFLTDKAIDPVSSAATRSIQETSPIPPASPAPPSVPPTPSVVATTPEPTTHLIPITPSLKRGASQAHQSEAGRKRTRASASARDDAALTVSTDGAENLVNLEPDFPNGPPTVWAMTRGDLCDSQHTFKSYQGGAYTKNCVVVSLYIDKYTEPRDFLGRNKLITCA